MKYQNKWHLFIINSQGIIHWLIFVIGELFFFLIYIYIWYPSSGAYDSIRASYNKSRDAEHRANRSTTDIPCTVSQSADTRKKTERLITQKRDDFNRKNAANKRTLTDLNAKAQNLDIKKINEKVSSSLRWAPQI